MNSRPRPGTVGAPYLAIRRPHDVTATPTTLADLAATAAAFARWRETTPLGARIPEALWSRAVELAGTHGVVRVAATLRLDYYRLKGRLTAESSAVAPPPPTSRSSRTPRNRSLRAVHRAPLLLYLSENPSALLATSQVKRE